ncbi:hypothetical protein [Paracraurococcus ruber]|uniref:Uncharacterized protein n=1 Tax=Paracraurococcus ruber TaxID=77675 RepID=A0ABS1D132_9PROT|nr:hypothetical protein [Paracraurococcus ruber]MBK1660320.1 hypothetical protein [Paracraurococcus ruber]TDG27725.1 hypothetical protein E2C05_22055 [Paracraurococcus ruber]
MTHTPTLAKRGPTRGTPKTAARDARSFIPKVQLLEIYNAFLFAWERGLDLNTWITINFRGSQGWKQGDQSADQISRTRDRFLTGIRKWCRSRQLPHVLVYSIENPAEGGHGPHILQHLPVENWVALRADLEEFLKSFGGWPASSFIKPPAEDTPPGSAAIERRWKPMFIDPERMSDWHWWVSDHDAIKRLRYISKGANPDEVLVVKGERVTLGQLAGRHLQVGEEKQIAEDGTVTWVPRRRPGVALKPQGNVRVTKRSGSTHTIGKAARAKHDWRDRTDLRWMCHAIYAPEMQARLMREMAAGPAARLASPAADKAMAAAE